MRVKPLLTRVAVVVALALAVAGCGGTPKKAPASVGTGVSDCRTQWDQLSKKYDGRDQDTMDSDLAPRWTSVLATLDYYATSATADDCGNTLVSQQSAIDALEDFSAKLRSLDMPYQASVVGAPTTSYLASPLPTPATKPKKKGKRPARPPSKKVVRQAYAVLRGNAAETRAELADGWAQANQVDLTPSAEAKAVSDLEFLAGQGPHFQACRLALKVVRKAITASGSAAE